MSDYVPTDWVDNVTPVDATRMDHLEAGVDQANTPIQDGGRLAVLAKFITDWNLAVETGFYRGDPATPNAPTAGVHYIGIVATHNTVSWVTQHVWAFTTAPNTALAPHYERRLTDLGWGPWIQTVIDPATVILKALIDAKGDLIGATAADTPARVPIGTDGHVLTADAAQALGLKWAPAAGGSTVEYENAWAAPTAYTPGDVVSHEGVEYLAVNPSTGEEPPAVNVVGPSVPISLVTALPSSPFDGQEIILTDALNAGTYHWRLRYVAARASNKWVYIGGSSPVVRVETKETTNNGSFVNLATVGPSFTVPVLGDYDVEFGAVFGFPSNVGSLTGGQIGVAVNDAVVGTFDIITNSFLQIGEWEAGAGSCRKTAVPAAAVVKLLYARQGASGSVTCAFEKRWIRVTPAVLGG